MAGTPTIYTGEDATVTITNNAGTPLAHTTLAISDFSLTLSKGTAEQELVGETGNYSIAGSLSAEGSLTACKLHNTAVGYLVSDMVNGLSIQVSGNCGSNSLHFFIRSCQITGFDFTLGDGDTITEGTVDFSVLKPYLVSSVGYNAEKRTYLSDQPLTMPYTKVA